MSPARAVADFRGAGPSSLWALGAVSLALLLAGAGGCGRRGPPQPELSAPPVELLAWQREGEGLVSWRLPSQPEIDSRGGLEGFRLLVERLPPRCASCPPDDEQVVRLVMGEPPLALEHGFAFYGFPLPERPSLWRFRVATVYRDGTTPASQGALLEAPADVPVHALMWEWAAAAPLPGGTRRVRLYWEPRRERLVRVISKEKNMVERERLFRANLYRRREDEPWPLRPLNGQPLQTRQVVLPIRLTDVTADEEAPAWEFTLRLVDQFGNEGAPAPTVSIPSTTTDTP